MEFDRFDRCWLPCLRNGRLAKPLGLALGWALISWHLVIGAGAPAHAQAANPVAAAPVSTPRLAVELNKLEPFDKGCRAYVVVTNPGAVAYQSVKVDLVLFQPDGVIGKRVAVDLAPLKPSKKTVKLFDLEGVACDRVASVLVNDVIDCKAESGPIADCLATIVFSSVSPAPLTTK